MDSYLFLDAGHVAKRHLVTTRVPEALHHGELGNKEVLIYDALLSFLAVQPRA